VDTLTATATIRLSVIGGKTFATGLSAPRDTISVQESQAYSYGTGSDEADGEWAKVFSFGSSGGSEKIGLDSLTDAFGDALTVAKIKAIYLRAPEDNADSVLVDARDTAISNGWWGAPWHATSDTTGGYLKLEPGTTVLFTDPNGWNVSAGNELVILSTSAASLEMVLITSSA